MIKLNVSQAMKLKKVPSSEHLHVCDARVCAELKGRVEHVHPVHDDHHVAHAVAVRIDSVGVGPFGVD